MKAKFCPFSKVQALPDPVDAVDLTVVEVKGRVTRRYEGVGARVTTDGEVAAAVDAYLVS